MKKLIISAIAATALLFGFASCSGDLHDDEKRPIDLSGGYYLVGSMTNSWTNTAADVIAFEKTETAGSYKVPFRADDTKVNFAFIPTPGDWNGQIGGDKMVGGDMPANAKFSDTDNGNGGRNGTIEGLEKDANYKLIVTALDDGTLKIDCSSNVPPVPYYLDGLYLVGDVFKLEGKDNAWAFDTTNLLWGASTEIRTGIVTYTKDIVAVRIDGELGINDSTWANKQLGAGVTIVAGEAAKTLDGVKEGNFKVSGLTVGKPYRVTVKTTPEKDVSVGIEEICKYTLKFKVTGLSEGDQAYINGNPWGSSWPNGWPIRSWNAEATKKAVTADSDGVATFDSTWDVTNIAKPGTLLSYEAKLVYIHDGYDWNEAEVEINAFKADGNFKFDVEISSEGIYLVTIDLAAEEVTAEKQ